MRKNILGVFLLGGYCSIVSATCPNSGDNRSPIGSLDTFLAQKTVCHGPAKNRNWQEYHGPGNSLTDYKKGPGDAMDPQKVVGTWQASGDSVTYTYVYGGAQKQYTFNLYDSNTVNGAYDFCPVGGAGTPVEGATLLNVSNNPIPCDIVVP